MLASVLVQRKVNPHGASLIPPSNATVEFDASPWGGGALLRVDGTATEYFVCRWTRASAGHLGVYPGNSKYQSFWEFFTLVLALILWADSYTASSLSVLGDSTSALQDALNLSGRREMVALAREVAWRQIRGQWQFRVGHLPAEHNLFADALSRRYAPQPVAFPDALASARERSALEPMHVWRAAVHFGLA